MLPLMDTIDSMIIPAITPPSRGSLPPIKFDLNLNLNLSLSLSLSCSINRKNGRLGNEEMLQSWSTCFLDYYCCLYYSHSCGIFLSSLLLTFSTSVFLFLFNSNAKSNTPSTFYLHLIFMMVFWISC